MSMQSSNKMAVAILLVGHGGPVSGVLRYLQRNEQEQMSSDQKNLTVGNSASTFKLLTFLIHLASLAGLDHQKRCLINILAWDTAGLWLLFELLAGEALEGFQR